MYIFIKLMAFLHSCCWGSRFQHLPWGCMEAAACSRGCTPAYSWQSFPQTGRCCLMDLQEMYWAKQGFRAESLLELEGKIQAIILKQNKISLKRCSCQRMRFKTICFQLNSSGLPNRVLEVKITFSQYCFHASWNAWK